MQLFRLAQETLSDCKSDVTERCLFKLSMTNNLSLQLYVEIASTIFGETLESNVQI